LIITRQDLLRLREWTMIRLNLRRAATPPVAHAPTPRMQALLQAKDRATETTKSPPAIRVEMSAPEPIHEAPQKPDQPAEPVKIAPEKPAPPETTSSTTTSLLERKKALRKKRE